MSAPDADLTIRPLTEPSDFDQCVALQHETWGPGFTEAVPPSILRITERTGGIAGGAFDADGRLVGFVFGLAGLDGGRPIHWSDMLAVRPERRGSGLGRRLKSWQRDVCLERGVTRMYWTYDPLESRNAWLNLGRLGAVGREYIRDMYGPGESPLHRGIGTDRLVAVWEMDSARVRARLAGAGPAPPALESVRDVPRAFQVGVDGALPRPMTTPTPSIPGDAGAPPPPASGQPPGALLVPIPADIQRLKSDDPDTAVLWREATRAALAPRLARGWEVRELVRASGPVSYYLLEDRSHRSPLT